MKHDLKRFLQSLNRKDNVNLMENVMKGYSYIFEGYSDVRDLNTVDAVTRFSQQVAYNASLDGNNILTFLQRSGENIANKYSIDTESELDNNPTSSIADPSYILSDNLDNQIDDIDDYDSSRSFENNLGLTAKDMKDLF